MPPKKFTKKPVPIEAQQLTPDTADEIALWCGGEYIMDPDSPYQTLTLRIPTLNGVVTATAGEYVIKGVKGEFYPCKDDIFKETYDEDPA